MSLIYVMILAVVQGLAELLPVSSSAHVVVTEKLLGLDPTSPQMTLLLVMLHTGTMFAVILYFWKQWRARYFASAEKFKRVALLLIVATILTGIVGEGLIKVVEHTLFRGTPHAEIENLFGRLDLIAPALAAAGVLILVAGLAAKGASGTNASASTEVSAEAFSFALAVILTPPVIAREALRLLRAEHAAGGASLGSAVLPSLLGALFSFLAGLLALKWLSQWLEKGRWYLFGIYCLIAAGGVEYLHHLGY